MSGELRRFGWCWDHSTNWTPAVHGRQTFGANQSYEKRPEVFLSDYKRLLDFLGRKGFVGLCVWGLLRESHGGVEAAREIVRYGRGRGVAVTPGVGLFTYGGAFYEGRHDYNLETFALKHPECIAVVADIEKGETLSFTQRADGTMTPDLAGVYVHLYPLLVHGKDRRTTSAAPAVETGSERQDHICLRGGGSWRTDDPYRTGEQRVVLGNGTPGHI